MDLFKDDFTNEGNPNDQKLGNDFIDLDDVNGNQDFSEQEQNIASDGYNQEQGNIDNQNEYDSQDNENDFSGFSDFDITNDDDLIPEMFPTGEEIIEASKQAPKPKPVEQSTEKNESENNDEFLNTINKKYKTNFKTEKEFNDFLQKTNNEELEQESAISDKEQQLYDKNKGSISYLDNLLQKEDRDFLREHEVIQFFKKNNRKPEAEDLELIEDKLERMEDNAVLGIAAGNERNKYSSEKEKLENYNNGVDNKIFQAKTAKQKQNQQQLMNSYKDLYLSQEGNFMGVKLSTEDLQATYNDVTSGEFVNRILKNPKLAATLSLVERHLESIQKNTSQPGYSDGIEAILKNNNNGKRMGSNARTSRSLGGNTLNSKDAAFLQ